MRWQDEWFTGHVSLGRLTIYGANAMHWALNFWTRKWGYICFHPPTKTFGRKWSWYFYISRNATPGDAIWGIGPGFEKKQDRGKRGLNLKLEGDDE